MTGLQRSVLTVASTIDNGRYRSLAVISNGLSGELPDALAILTD
jgi:hypothetical protein